MNVTSTPPKHSAVQRIGITASSLGNNTLVVAQTGKKIRVLGFVAVSTLANSIKLQSASTDITGLFPLGANGCFTLPYCDHGWCETAEGEALNINMSVATSTGVQLVYMVI